METKQHESEMIITLPKRGRGRPIKNPNGIKNNAPLDKNYFNNYYKEKLAVKIQCPVCSELISKSKMRQHQKTNKCINFNEGGFRCNICNKSTSESRLKIHQISKYCTSFLS